MLSRVTRLFVSIVVLHSLGKQAQAQVDLGTAASFGVLAASAITSISPTIINGQIGIYPAAAGSVTGFPAGTVIVDGDVAKRAQLDAKNAYNVAASLPSPTDKTGQDFGGQLLVPGTYVASSSIGITGVLTLDGQGNPNAQFVFQIGSTLTTATASSVVLINGARVCNVFWQIGSSATLGTGTTFSGSIIAQASITLTAGVTVNGGLYALTGAVTLGANDQVTAPQRCPQQPIGTTSSVSIAISSMTPSPVSTPGPGDTTFSQTTTTLPNQGVSSEGSNTDSRSSNVGATVPGNGISTTNRGNSVSASLPANTINTDSSRNTLATTSSRNEVSSILLRSSRVTSLPANTISTESSRISTTKTDSKSTIKTLSTQTVSSKLKSTTLSTTKLLSSKSSRALQSTISSRLQASKSYGPSSSKKHTASLTSSTYWKTLTTTAPSTLTTSTSKDKTTTHKQDEYTSKKDKNTTKKQDECTSKKEKTTTSKQYEYTSKKDKTTTSKQYEYTSTRGGKITTIHGTPCTTISYYEPTCSCSTTTIVPLAFTPTPSPEVSVVTVDGVQCTANAQSAETL
jgi:hypothetical protein